MWADVHGYSGFVGTVIVQTQSESEIKIQHMQNATQVYLNTALYKYTDLSQEQVAYYSVPTYYFTHTPDFCPKFFHILSTC